jgi:hypothetical protein
MAQAVVAFFEFIHADHVPHFFVVLFVIGANIFVGFRAIAQSTKAFLIHS